MTVMIAAAGTGGHVFPGLSVAEALIDLGTPRSDIHFVGGSRLEASVYPAEGFPFLEVEIRGLKRSASLRNLTLPAVVFRARKRIRRSIDQFGIGAVLGMGGYVTIPAAMAASSAKVPFLNAEQNAEAGLANRWAAKRAVRTFTAFPDTTGLPDGEWVGNPVREPFWHFDRDRLRDRAMAHYGLEAGIPTLGVFGGSLGAAVLNDAATSLATSGLSRFFQIVHLTGEQHLRSIEEIQPADAVHWRRVAFEEDMDLFYAASDLVLARAGGAVAELTATSTPAILVPGSFGSSGHQAGNALFLKNSGAAVTILQDEIERLPGVVEEILFDESRLDEMRAASKRIARPDAAKTIATALLEAA